MSQKSSPQIQSLETAISGSDNVAIIEKALDSYFSGLTEFLFPKALKNDPKLAEYAQMKAVFTSRINKVTPLATDIIAEINKRTLELNSKDYRSLVETERAQWKQGEARDLAFGARACVDQGIPREAVVGDGPMGRSLAGDDLFHFVAAKNHFAFNPSTFKKRLIHFGRMGEKVVVELLIEHTGCGRRGQMIANWASKNEYAYLFKEVLTHVDALKSEFSYDAEKFALLKKAVAMQNLTMAKDGGMWIGVLVKMAQRQAFAHIGTDVTVICPIQLYDKFNGNILVGLDQLLVLTHPTVLAEGGFTPVAIQKLLSEKLIFSLKDEITKLDLANVLPVKKGAYTFADLQKNWFEVKKAFVSVTEALWQQYNYKKDAKFTHVVENFLELSLKNLGQSISKRIDTSVSEDLIRRRLTHQLFRALAYAWVLDTFEKGHPPGKHIENHLATGDSATLGVKQNLPLGQGDMNPPQASEFFTGRAVLMHSTPGHHGEPLLVFLKLDTDRADDAPMSTEETQRAIDDFTEFMKLWPYFLTGDIIPVVFIRSKKHGGVSRLGLSVVKAFGDIVDMYSAGLPDLVFAANSKSEVVKVSALSVLKAGISAGENLKTFRAHVEVLADTISDPDIQKYLR